MRMTRFPQFRKAVAKTDAKLLFNRYTRYQDLVIGCWYRPYHYGHKDMLTAMEKEPGVKYCFAIGRKIICTTCGKPM